MILQAHQFCYQWKARMPLSICESCTVSEIWRIIGPTFALASFWRTRWGRTLNLRWGNLASKKLETSVPRMVQGHFDISSRLGEDQECDGRTDGQYGI